MDQEARREAYWKRYQAFCDSARDLDITETLNQVPGVKSYWANELTKVEGELIKLERKKRELMDSLKKKLLEDSPVGSLNKGTLTKIEQSDAIILMNEEIKDLKLTVQHVERIYNCAQYCAKDFENILRYLSMQEG